MDEEADGTFRGRLEYPGTPGWGPDALRASVVARASNEWEITITGKSPGDDAVYTYTVHASVAEPDD